MKTLAKKESVVLIEEDGLYSVMDMENGEFIYKDTKYIQLAEEEFLHYWRYKYMNNDKMLDLYESKNRSYGIRF